MGFFEDFQPIVKAGLQDFFMGLAVYNTTPPVSCYVKIERDVSVQPDSYDAQVIEVGTTLEAIFADVGTPVKGATFTADGSTFTVKRIQDNNKTWIKLVVTEA